MVWDYYSTGLIYRCCVDVSSCEHCQGIQAVAGMIKSGLTRDYHLLEGQVIYVDAALVQVTGDCKWMLSI